MDIQRLTVGQMARLNRVPPETLRRYDREKLLQPRSIDEATGYRYYHINQSARLDMILYLQAHGIQLKQIRHHLEDSDPEVLCGLLRNQLNAIDENIRRLRQSRGAIARMIANHERRKSLPLNHTPYYEYLPSRRIYKHRTNKDFFEQDGSGYELMLRELKHSLVASNLPVSYFCNVGTLVRQRHLEKRQLFSNEVFFIPALINAQPGYISTDMMPNNVYPVRFLGEYVK